VVNDLGLPGGSVRRGRGGGLARLSLNPAEKQSSSDGGNGMSSTNGNPIQTTDAGIPVESDKYSLTVGAGGPILLQDSYLIEQMANFNRERITERQPHAKGSGAFGRIEVTHDVSAFTKAALFQPGTTTRMLSRFSTVAGERGSPDMWRDLRRLLAEVLHQRGQLRHGR
jgi:catalase